MNGFCVEAPFHVVGRSSRSLRVLRSFSYDGLFCSIGRSTAITVREESRGAGDEHLLILDWPRGSLSTFDGDMLGDERNEDWKSGNSRFGYDPACVRSRREVSVDGESVAKS